MQCVKRYIYVYVYNVYISIMWLDAYVYIYSLIIRRSVIFVTVFPGSIMLSHRQTLKLVAEKP